jgi:TatD DNase family protein
MIIDTHCHLDKEDYNNLDEIIKEMNDNIMIATAVDLKTSKHVVELCNKYKNIYGVIGFHPTELDKYSEEALEELEKLLQQEKIVGIGEIGLDYHYGKENKLLQQEVFIKQIKLAQKYNLPIVIHSRDAALDTLEIIKKYKTENMKIDMHCYSYSLEIAEQLIKMNVKLGIGGVLTFKNSHKLKEIVEKFDLTNFLLETDSPYLTPEPYRGTTNKPYYVEIVAKKVAEIKNISEEEVKRITTETAICQFDLNI